MAGKINWSIREWGEPDHPVLLLLHGFMGSARDWNPIARQLSAEHHCLAPDLPGHGETQILSPHYSFTIKEMAADIYAELSSRGIRSCRLLGYSMGGRIAWRMAVDYPDLVERLVVESASPGLQTDAERKGRLGTDRAWAQKLRTEPFAQFLKEWYNQPLFDSLRNHSGFSELMNHRTSNNPQALADCLIGASPATQSPLWERLHDIRCPVLLIAGEYDKKYVSLLGEAAKKIGKARLEIVPGAGHNVHFEKPGEYNVVVSRFLNY